jgi:hypothetical protein
MITAFNRQQTRPIKKSSSLKPRSRRSKSHGQASLSNYLSGQMSSLQGVQSIRKKKNA